VATIVWPDAEDNTGVTAYKIYKDGQLINTLGGDVNNVNVTGLAADTEYAFKVRAVDAAGNISTSLSKNFLTD
jgi:chitodextrinase